MDNHITENNIIQNTGRFLLLRDVLLFLLILAHAGLYYNLLADAENYIYIFIAAIAVLIMLLYLRLIMYARNAGKNDYLKNAFKDELFEMIKMKSYYHGFIGMVSVILMFILINVISGSFGEAIEIPMVFTCEALLLTGIIVSDISKIRQSRG